MSKQKLKKEIERLERHQLEQMILDAYAAKKEIREYFDFFLNPDIDKLSDKYKIAVSKEFSRSKRGHSKARISQIKKIVKDFEGFQPGFDVEIDLLLYIINFALLTEINVYFSETLMKGIAAITHKMIEIADRNLVADKVLMDLMTLLNSETGGSRYFRRYIRESIESIRPA